MTSKPGSYLSLHFSNSTLEVIAKALRAGFAASRREQATSYYAASWQGTSLYHHVTGQLGEALDHELGWMQDHADNWVRVRAPGGEELAVRTAVHAAGGLLRVDRVGGDSMCAQAVERTARVLARQPELFAHDHVAVDAAATVFVAVAERNGRQRAELQVADSVKDDALVPVDRLVLFDEPVPLALLGPAVVVAAASLPTGPGKATATRKRNRKEEKGGE